VKSQCRFAFHPRFFFTLGLKQPKLFQKKIFNLTLQSQTVVEINLKIFSWSRNGFFRFPSLKIVAKFSLESLLETGDIL